jgi:hypothetical protein
MIVCGFGDVSAGIGGLAWDLGEPGALLLAEGVVQPGTFAIEEGEAAATLEITAGETTVEASLAFDSEVIVDADSAHPADLTVTPGKAEVRRKGASGTVDCVGHLSRWHGNESAGATLRHLAIGAGEGGMLLVTSWGAAGAGGHGDESTLGWRFDSGGGSAFEESLVSTQYDAASEPTRFGLELWPQDADQTSRAAATRVACSLIGGIASGGTWAGLFRCHTDGAEGLGSYLLWRA